MSSTQNERDRLFLRLLWETGVTVSEAITLKLSNVERHGVRVNGKSGAERQVFVQDSLISDILFYAQERRVDRCDYLFPSRRGGYITKQRADQIIKDAGRRAHLKTEPHALQFRHGYAINFLKLGGRLDVLQRQLGHRDINTTMKYLNLTEEDIRADVSKVRF